LLDPLEERCLLSFGTPSLFDNGTKGENNTAVAIGDVNGDGIPDIVSGTEKGTLSIALGYGDGTFRPPALISTPASSISAVKLGDFNGDQKLDIVAADPGGNQVWVLLNQGGGAFITLPALPTGLHPMAIAVAGAAADLNGDTVADLNGDGHADIITANASDNTVSVLLGNGDGTFSEPHPDDPVDTQPVAVAIADLNMDGHPDLVTANSVGNSVSVLLNQGDGTFQPRLDVPITVPAPPPTDTHDSPISNPTSLAVGDFNGDGYPDLVTANSGRASVNIMFGKGDGSFGAHQTIDTLTYLSDNNDPLNPDSPTSVVAADLDGDGFVDIALTEPNHCRIGLLSGKGDGTFSTRVDSVAIARGTVLAVGNLNGDFTSLGHDRLDLVAVSSSDNRTSVLLGQKYAIPMTLGIGTSTITWGDSVNVTPGVSAGFTPPVGPLTGAFQLTVEGQPYGVPQPASSTFVINRLAAGTHTLGAHYLGDLDCDPRDTSTISISVVPARLTLTALDQTRTYGDVNTSLTNGYVITGFVNGDFFEPSKLLVAPVITTTAKGGISPGGSPVGDYPITINLTIPAGMKPYNDPNYSLDPQYRNGKLTIQPVPLTVTADDMQRPYGGSNPTFTYHVTGFVPGESMNQSDLTGQPSLSTTALEASPAGSYPIAIRIGSLASSNYTISLQPGTLTIKPAPLTITVNDQSRVYGAPNPTSTYTISGFVNGETQATSDLSGAPTFSTFAGLTSPVGSYSVTFFLGFHSSNYAVSYQPGTLTITPAVLTVAAVNTTRGYGIPNPELSYSLTGFANGATAATGGVTGSPTLSTTAQVDSPLGAYPITVDQGTLSATNYTFQSFQPATLTITRAALIVKVQDLQRSYGTANPALTYTVVREDWPGTSVSVAEAGLSGAPVLSTTAVATSPMGSYPITAAPGTLTAANINYSLDFVNSLNGTLTITQASLVITANNASRVYGAGDPTFTYTITGFIIGGINDVTGQPSFQTTAVSTSHVGSYRILPGLGSLKSQQYTFTFAPGVLTVTPAPLIIAANSTSQSVGSDPNLTASYLGLVNGDTSASLETPAVLTTTATRNSPSGVYPIAVSGATASDYDITFVPGTLTVVKAATTSTFTGLSIRAAVAPPVTFVVKVTPRGVLSVPVTGIVRFYDGARVIGDAAVVNGTATLTTSALSQGNHAVTAVYQGDANYTGSSAAPVFQMVYRVASAIRANRPTPVLHTPAKKKTPRKPSVRTVVKAKASPAHAAPAKPAASF
jgi:hypothetical protein